MVSHGEHRNGGGGECGGGHSDGEILVVHDFLFFHDLFFDDGQVVTEHTGDPAPGRLGVSINCCFLGSNVGISGGQGVQSAGDCDGWSLSDGIGDLGSTAVIVVG